MQHYNHCFEKHNFEELNNIDVYPLYTCFNFYLQKYNTINPVIFDVGSNAGSFVKVLYHCNIQTNIHCFEPHPVISKKTKEVYPHIIMNEYCLGNINDTIDIYIPKWSVGLSSIINRPCFSQLNQDIAVLHVKCEKLDTYCELNNINTIDFIKLDVEGAEKTIFEGAIRMLENNQIKCGMFEVGQTLTDANTSEEEIILLLEKYGYSINKTIVPNDYVFYLD